jgi:hypothetical protein
MDPALCYDEFFDALKAGRLSEACDRADDLEQWFRKGGFVPPKLEARKMSAPLLAEMFFQTSLVLMWARSDIEDD